MPKWSKEAKDFKVSVNCHGERGCYAQVPKPIMEMLGNPSKVRYVVKGSKIEVENGDLEPQKALTVNAPSRRPKS